MTLLPWTLAISEQSDEDHQPTYGCQIEGELQIDEANHLFVYLKVFLPS
jgi:hypothetical protein